MLCHLLGNHRSIKASKVIVFLKIEQHLFKEIDMGSYDTGIKSLVTLTNAHTAAPQIAAAGVAAQKGEVGSTSIGGAQIVVTGIETLGKSVPYAGPLLSGTSLVSNSIDIGNQYHDKNGQVETQKILTVIIHAPSHAQNLTSTKNWQTLRPTLVDRS